MKKIKNFFIIYVLSVLLVCSGCTEIIKNESDEIRSFDWCTKNDEIYATLSFKNENAALTINSYGENCIINGLCIISDNTVIIIDNNLKNEYKFKYTLDGKALSLERNGSNVTFYKVC